ncbi:MULTISPECIES: M23 family metallopeptidase [Listeria]|uniref:M23 family metallopeptidase n=1 Tax=Listeria TaxID=1637 RepID=UPI0010AF6A11|nr:MULTISPECIES: peptidoglycan DD-metalloendopeptidase family protein [Listeria]EAC2922390.1 M23 family peptidase [Listeria monocytogenes]MBC1514229.1 peptidoglycan DD-metalloendopeptidase family protein [Listeria booriae]MBC1557006.1 peptidoglycan DD-metalloendopeptidase family protein [Listeria seeligeri]
MRGIIVALLFGFIVLFIFFFSFSPSDSTNDSTDELRCSAYGDQPSANDLNKYLKGKGVFEGKGKTFIDAGKKFGVDPKLVIAIAMHETGNGTSVMVRKKNNPGGLMGSGKPFVFDSLDEGIAAMTKNLNKLYISQGLTTVEQIGAKYAPIGAANDPRNLNANWVPAISKTIKKLGGITYNCKAEVSSKGFIAPVSPIRITDHFGSRILNGKAEFHKGMDFGGKQGMNTPIMAAKGGEVVFSGFANYGDGTGFGGYGQCVVIKHAPNQFTLYGHMVQNSQKVKLGDMVKQGQTIGIMGQTGAAFGVHLHFEVRRQLTGGQVNPEPLLPK